MSDRSLRTSRPLVLASLLALASLASCVGDPELETAALRPESYQVLAEGDADGAVEMLSGSLETLEAAYASAPSFAVLDEVTLTWLPGEGYSDLLETPRALFPPTFGQPLPPEVFTSGEKDDFSLPSGLLEIRSEERVDGGRIWSYDGLTTGPSSVELRYWEVPAQLDELRLTLGHRRFARSLGRLLGEGQSIHIPQLVLRYGDAGQPTEVVTVTYDQELSERALAGIVVGYLLGSASGFDLAASMRESGFTCGGCELLAKAYKLFFNSRVLFGTIGCAVAGYAAFVVGAILSNGFGSVPAGWITFGVCEVALVSYEDWKHGDQATDFASHFCSHSVPVCTDPDAPIY